MPVLSVSYRDGHTLYRRADKASVNRFAEHALQILEAAESATARGETCSDMTIVIGGDGAITLLADSDWHLDALAWHHGAKAVYRVNERNGAVRVEGREGSRRCVIESPAAAGTSSPPRGWPLG